MSGQPAYARIEGTTEEIRLQDLERKGIRRVRVLRPSDIERMIQDILAETLVGPKREGEELVEHSRKALLQRMKEVQAQMAAADKAEAEIDRRKGANAALGAGLSEARARLAKAEAAIAELRAEGERLEAEGKALEEALARAKAAELDAAREAGRLEREGAALEARLAKVQASLAEGEGLVPAVEEAEARAAAAEARVAALERELQAVAQEW